MICDEGGSGSQNKSDLTSLFLKKKTRKMSRSYFVLLLVVAYFAYLCLIYFVNIALYFVEHFRSSNRHNQRERGGGGEVVTSML